MCLIGFLLPCVLNVFVKEFCPFVDIICDNKISSVKVCNVWANVTQNLIMLTLSSYNSCIVLASYALDIVVGSVVE